MQTFPGYLSQVQVQHHCREETGTNSPPPTPVPASWESAGGQRRPEAAGPAARPPFISAPPLSTRLLCGDLPALDDSQAASWEGGEPGSATFCLKTSRQGTENIRSEAFQTEHSWI